MFNLLDYNFLLHKWQKDPQTSLSPPFPTAGLGPCELSCSHLSDGKGQLRVYWSTCNDEVHCVQPPLAVCLQSPCPNKCIYVLEFFLPTKEEDDDDDDPRTLLPMLMKTLKRHLQSSFKIASGQELGQKLTVEVVKISSKDEYDSCEISNTTGIESTPRLVGVQGGGKMQLDFSSQQVHAANGSINGIHE
ncbi:unnamed protein product [Coffea canephora]|uniref:DH200=94 genomic scaffold, scaffold_2639 n=1 Tax=Coffea canephora TaxID=49390 RepID=A0A068VK40_COFCA|nr:unnamed protein product [Coffea canephora]